MLVNSIWSLASLWTKIHGARKRFTTDLYLEKGVVLHLNKLESLSPNLDVLYQVGLNWPSGSGEEGSHVKFFKTDGQRDDRR